MSACMCVFLSKWRGVRGDRAEAGAARAAQAAHPGWADAGPQNETGQDRSGVEEGSLMDTVDQR